MGILNKGFNTIYTFTARFSNWLITYEQWAAKTQNQSIKVIPPAFSNIFFDVNTLSFHHFCNLRSIINSRQIKRFQ